MTRHLLATFLIVNGSIAVAFGIFYQLVLLCTGFGVSAWFAFVITIFGVSFCLWRMQRAAVREWEDQNANDFRLDALPLYETRNPDSIGE